MRSLLGKAASNIIFARYFMTEKLQAFFVSKWTQRLALWLGLLSLLLSILCFVAPLNREKWAVESLGETSLSELSPLAMSITHYEPERLRYLITTGTTGPTYEKLVQLLNEAQNTLGFERLYLLYQGEDGTLRYLADSSYAAGEDNGAPMPGDPYIEGYHDKACRRKVESLLAQKAEASYISDIYDGELVLTYVPLMDGETGGVMAVLAGEAALQYTNFTQIHGIELEHVSQVLLGIFVLCVVCLFLGYILSDDHDNKNSKGDHAIGRWFQKPTVTQQDNNVFIDPLDDVDPADYM